MINNRQAGRRRGRGGQQQRPQGNSGARDNGNRIDNRSRGNAAQLLEKYKALARDAQMSGDRVNTEYYLQFADHYFRVLAETRSRFEENRAPAQGGANTFQDDETEYDDDGAPIVPEQSRQQNGNQNYQGDRQQQTNGNQQDRPERQERAERPERQDRQANDRNDRNDRADRGQQDDDRPRRANTSSNAGSGATYGNEGERYVREDRGRNDNRGNEGRNAEGRNAEGRNEGRGNRADRNDRYQSEDRAPVQQDRAPVQQDTAPQAAPVDEQPQEAPRRRGRPRREPVAEAPAEFDTAILPPSLNISAAAPVAAEAAPANDVAGGEPEEKPRRRRGRPPASEASNAS